MAADPLAEGVRSFVVSRLKSPGPPGCLACCCDGCDWESVLVLVGRASPGGGRGGRSFARLAMVIVLSRDAGNG